MEVSQEKKKELHDATTTTSIFLREKNFHFDLKRIKREKEKVLYSIILFLTYM